MNKSQFIEVLSAHFEGNKKSASQALDAVIDTITREVSKGEKVALTGFGAFEKAIRPARLVRNPQTGERIRAKKKAVPKFRPGAELKDVVAGVKKLPKLNTTSTAAKKTTTARSTPSSSSSAAKKAPASKTAAKKAPVAKKAASGSTAARSTATKTAAKKATTTRATATKTAAKATAAKKAPATRSTAAKKATTTRSAAKKA